MANKVTNSTGAASREVGENTSYPFAAVLFDLDGVLVDTTELHYHVWDQFGRQHGYTPTRAELVATNGRRADENIRAWLGADLDEQTVTALVADREAEFNRLLGTEPMDAVPGAKVFVAALSAASVPMAVVTSAVPDNAELALARVGLSGVFAVVVRVCEKIKTV
jgi:beta-phosphoglucomutase-like phosphatase (HAD superfamily)